MKKFSRRDNSITTCSKGGEPKAEFFRKALTEGRVSMQQLSEKRVCMAMVLVGRGVLQALLMKPTLRSSLPCASLRQQTVRSASWRELLYAAAPTANRSLKVLPNANEKAVAIATAAQSNNWSKGEKSGGPQEPRAAAPRDRGNGITWCKFRSNSRPAGTAEALPCFYWKHILERA